MGLTQDDFRPIEDAVMRERDMTKARALVTPQMLRIGVVGTPFDLIERLEPLVAQGMRHLSFGPPLGPDPALAIRLIGQHIIPHFRRD